VREGSQSKVFSVGDFNTTQVDFAISLNALKAMKAHGRAALILRGVMQERGDSPDLSCHRAR